MYVGVDTHKKTHVLFAIDVHGQTRGSRTVVNSPEGWATAVRWGREQSDTRLWGIENSGSLGQGFAQFLLAQGERDVREISPQRTAHYRRRGRTQDKTDAADALAIARLLHAEGEQLPLVRADDASTELRLLSDHRGNLVGERTRFINQLHAQMLQVDPCDKEKSGVLTTATGVRYCRDLVVPHADRILQTRLLIVRQLAEQVIRLREEIESIETTLRQRVQESATPLVQVCGVGTLVAARLLGEWGCTPRIHSAAALATLAGIAPVAVSSGGRHGHRRNRGGNRQLNKVCHIIALCQVRREALAQAYDAKKRSEGKTARAAMRCLKRRLVDVVYRVLRATGRANDPHEGESLLHNPLVDAAA